MNIPILESPLLFLIYAAIMAGCVWLFTAVYDEGWVIGFPIALAIGVTQVLVFDKDD